jgi:CheY-like chemotaxis protein
MQGPVVVPVDIRMPKTDGIELLCQMKFDAGLKVIPVVMRTSYN